MSGNGEMWLLQKFENPDTAFNVLLRLEVQEEHTQD